VFNYLSISINARFPTANPQAQHTRKKGAQSAPSITTKEHLPVVGPVVGRLEGADVGRAEGAEEGALVGSPEGAAEGAFVGRPEGAGEGALVGKLEGAAEGAVVGKPEGAGEGALVGGTWKKIWKQRNGSQYGK